METNTLGCFGGIAVKISEYLPDNEMFISKNTFDKMQKWFGDNVPMKKMSEAEKLRYKTQPSGNQQTQPKICPKCGHQVWLPKYKNALYRCCMAQSCGWRGKL